MAATGPVFVRSSHDSAGPRTCYHTDADCPRLQQANGFYRVDREKLDGLHHCEWCSGRVRQPARSDFSHYRALTNAGGGD